MRFFNRKKYPEGAKDNTSRMRDVYAGPPEEPADVNDEPVMEDVYAGPPLPEEKDTKKRPRFERVYAGPPSERPARRPKFEAVYAGPSMMDPPNIDPARMEGVYAGPSPAPAPAPIQDPDNAPIGAVYAGPAQMDSEQQRMIQASIQQTMLVYAGPDYWNPKKPDVRNYAPPVENWENLPTFTPTVEYVPTDSEPKKTDPHFCSMCGAKRNGPGKFCPECGYKYDVPYPDDGEALV